MRQYFNMRKKNHKTLGLLVALVLANLAQSTHICYLEVGPIGKLLFPIGLRSCTLQDLDSQTAVMLRI